ncbi:MAG: WG repeat-containing protein [Clostridia bacterium]|nr:WG repeat-containing protein [Clostridia bacterium]
MKKTIKMKKLICLVLSCLLLSGAIPSYVFAEGENHKLPYVIEPRFESADAFNKHGIARVQLPSTESGVGESGVINLKGEKVFGFDGTKFVIRKNGLIMALGENDKAAFFSKDGVQLTDYVYETFKRVQQKTPHEVTYPYLTDYFDGDGESDLVPICRDGKFGFINSRGEEAILPTFNYVFGFYEGISRIGYDGVLSEYGTYTQCKYGYINEKGEVLINPLWAASDFSNGYALIADGQYKVIDKSMQAVTFPTGVYNFSETNGNFILASHADGGNVVLDMQGNLLSDWAPNIQLFGKSFIIWQRQIADINGNIIYTAPEGTRIDMPRKGSYVAKIYKYTTQNKVSVQVDGLVNQDGEVIIEPQYKGLREVAEGIFWTPDSTSLFDVNGNSIAQLEGYSVSAYNKLSYKLLPVQSAETHKWGYVELPQTENPYVSKYTESNIYKVYNKFDTDYGTVLYLQVVGAPHATGPFLLLVRENGEEIDFSKAVSRETPWACPAHNDIKISEDGRYMTFNVSFDERSAGNMVNGNYVVLHDAGTYYYKADLEKGTCIETRFEPLDKMGEDVLSAWAKPEVEKAIDLGFVPIYLRENYKRNITRAEFAKMAMDFLSFSYGYSNATRGKGWSEVDYEKRGIINHEFLCAYCHAKPDRNGNPFMSGDAAYQYNSNLAIHMAEPFAYTEDFLYYDAVTAAYNIGIVNGVSETEFNPNGDITRQEAAAMLMRVYKNYGECADIQSDDLFSDHDVIADWAKEDVYGVNRLGVMQGMGNDVFAPLEHYTVEQAIATFLRLYENAPVSRKNKNIAPLLDFAFEKEKLLEGNPAGRGWVIAEEKETVLDDYTILQGAWNMRHYGMSDTIYVFYKSGGVTTLFSGQLTSEVEIDAAKNVIRYSAIAPDTFRLYNQLCGSEKVYAKGEYLYEKDIETGNILRLERLA